MESKVSTLFSTLVAPLVAVKSPSLNLANVLGPVLVGRITSIYFVPKIPGRVSVRKYVASVPSGQGFGRTTKISFRLAGWTWPERLPKCRTIYRSCGNYCCFAETGYNHPQRLRKDLDAFTALSNWGPYISCPYFIRSIPSTFTIKRKSRGVSRKPHTAVTNKHCATLRFKTCGLATMFVGLVVSGPSWSSLVSPSPVRSGNNSSSA